MSKELSWHLCLGYSKMYPWITPGIIDIIVGNFDEPLYIGSCSQIEIAKPSIVREVGRHVTGLLVGVEWNFRRTIADIANEGWFLEGRVAIAGAGEDVKLIEVGLTKELYSTVRLPAIKL